MAIEDILLPAILVITAIGVPLLILGGLLFLVLLVILIFYFMTRKPTMPKAKADYSIDQLKPAG